MLPLILLTSLSLLSQPLSKPASVWPDLARLPSSSSRVGAQDAVVVVGVERYSHLSPVTGATRNSADWYRYFTKVRGVPATHARLLEDDQATPNRIRKAIREVAPKVGEGGQLWFVFIGHGAPSKDGKDGVLVCVDAHRSEIDFFDDTLARRALVSLLRSAQARRPAVEPILIVDTCFSGKDTDGRSLRKGEQITVARGWRGRLDEEGEGDGDGGGGSVLISAGDDDEIAGALPGEARPAFSYLLLGALRGWGEDTNGDGAIMASEAVAYARDALLTVRSGGGPRQTPQLSGGDPVLSRRRAVRDPVAAPNLVDVRMSLRRKSPVSPTPPPPEPLPGPGEIVVTDPPVRDGLPNGPRVTTRRPTAACSHLTVTASPKDAVSMAVTDPEGETYKSGSLFQAPCARVGDWKVRVTAAGYEAKEQIFYVPPDKHLSLPDIELKKLGSLQVDGGPEGARLVLLAASGAKVAEGAIPGCLVEGLATGSYTVKVSREGYEEHQDTVYIAPGPTVKREVVLREVRRGWVGGGRAGAAPEGCASMEDGHVMLRFRDRT
jgi:hypothetical protein